MARWIRWSSYSLVGMRSFIFPQMETYTLKIAPLTVNTLWRVNYQTKRMYRSPKYTEWSKNCRLALNEVWKAPLITSPCTLVVSFSVCRVGDLDNMLKSLLDNMQGIVFENDKLIDKIVATRQKVAKGEESIVFSISLS
jgi:Holliday junction resolvase RusA-like endonuclease